MVESAPSNESRNDSSDETQPLLQRVGSEAVPTKVPSAVRQGSSLTRPATFAVLLTGALIANLDTSFVLATYNSISSEFNQASDGPWILISYNLGYSVVLPMYGAFGDNYGSLPPLLVAYALFGAGCALSGAAAKFWQVILGRALSGAGGAGMVAMVAFIITENAPPEKVAVLRSYVNLISILGRSSGGPIGGILTDAVGWRWSFIGQIPVAGMCWLCVAWLSIASLKQKSSEEQPSELTTATSVKKKRSVDWPGIVTFAVMMTSFLIAITMLDDSSHLAQKTYGYVLMGISAVLAITLLLIERYYATTPLIPLQLIWGTLGVQMLIQLLLLCAQFAIVSNAASYFVRTEGTSNLTAALHLLPIAAGNAVGALFAGRIIQKTKRYKTLGSLGLCSSSLGFLLLTLRWRGRISVFESLYIVFTSIGVGVVNSTQFVALTTSAPKERMASMLSLFLLSQQLGTIIGTSGSAAILHTVFRKGLAEGLGGLVDGDQIIQRILDDTRYAFTLPAALQDVVVRSYTSGFATVSGLSTLISIILQVILASLKELSLG